MQNEFTAVVERDGKRFIASRLTLAEEYGGTTPDDMACRADAILA